MRDTSAAGSVTTVLPLLCLCLVYVLRHTTLTFVGVHGCR